MPHTLKFDIEDHLYAQLKVIAKEQHWKPGVLARYLVEKYASESLGQSYITLPVTEAPFTASVRPKESKVISSPGSTLDSLLPPPKGWEFSHQKGVWIAPDGTTHVDEGKWIYTAFKPGPDDLPIPRQRKPPTPEIPAFKPPTKDDVPPLPGKRPGDGFLPWTPVELAKVYEKPPGGWWYDHEREVWIDNTGTPHEYGYQRFGTPKKPE